MPSYSANTPSGTDIGSGSYAWTEYAMGSGSKIKMAFAVSSGFVEGTESAVGSS